MDTNIKQNVREFYDQIGWQEVGDGLYQNARYEDLRPVSREYIHKCHLRVKRHLKPAGHLLLDAGSGPIQYPEYLTYSEGYDFRVCADISIQALMEARKRIGNHGIFVVCDVANLPFRPEIFDGLVSLHTIHHIPIEEHLQAYRELQRVMLPGSQGVVVNGWHRSFLGDTLGGLQKLTVRTFSFIKRRLSRQSKQRAHDSADEAKPKSARQKGTFVQKNTASRFEKEIGSQVPHEIFVWRSVGVNVLRTFIHEKWGGRGILRFLFWLEDRFPHWFGKNGQYPLIVIQKQLKAEG